jgi:hypothetical protein
LLDQTTTSYVDGLKTDSSVVSNSRSMKSSQTLAPVQSDPFHSTLDSFAARKPSSREETDGIRLTTTKSKLDNSHTIREVESSHTGDDSPPAQATRQTPSSEMMAALPSASRTSIQNHRPPDGAGSQELVAPMKPTTEEQTTYHIAPISSVDASVLPNSRPLAYGEAIASSHDVRFDTVNSLVQDIGST